MLENSDRLRAYADRYGDMFPVRIATIAAIVVVAWLVLGPAWGLNYAVFQLGLYIPLWQAVQAARARPDAAGRVI